MKSLGYKYLSDATLGGFSSYKYNCIDSSPLSNYIMHPFWNKAVLLCPKTIAPNLLTFVGFICCFGHFFLFTIYDYYYSASVVNSPVPIPSWVWLAAGFLLFISHTLDGIDGKQARRTGTSGPLGELFDHGCDSWSTLFITASLYSVFGKNLDGLSISVERMYGLIWAVFLNFHISHWEKYNTGIMYLPWAYDVSMVGGVLLYLATFFLGVSAWKVKVFGYSPGFLMESATYLGSVGITVPVSIYNVIQSYRHRTGKCRPLYDCMEPLFPFFIAFFFCLFWACFSSNEILKEDPRCFYFMTGVLYTNIACRLIVAQMSDTSPGVFCPPLPIIGFGTVLGCLSNSVSDELYVLYSVTTFLMIIHVHYAVNVVNQLCQFFGIECFSIKQYRINNSEDSSQRLLSEEV